MGVDLADHEPFGPYLVYERLGVGGMATVHRALERGIEGFERIVALKRLLPHLAEDGSFIKSFVREAKLASFLNHVNIVQIYELGRVGTEYFISMELIDGRDIRRILRHARKVTGPPPIHVTVGLMLQLCEALDYAHTKADEQGTPLGLVHRDVSPSNLLVTQAGHLKVIDFGIAKAQSQQLRTQTGRVKGKLAYMAPEAVTGKELDSRSDLFAAGVILHELLTARPLFARKNEYETLMKVQKGEIFAPSHFNQACPQELDAICLRALERDPDARWASAAEMRDALHDLRRQYNLQTGHRDISQWLTWAFSIEPPSSSFGAAGTGGDHSLSFESKHMKRTPQPRREDEEAVEIAWGGGEAEGSAEPVVLDEVPDVSEKHLRDARSQFGAGLEDDIPASMPSHGHARERFGGHDDALDSIPELPPPPRRVSVPMPAQRAQTAASLLPGPAQRAPTTAKTPVPQLARPRTTSPHAVPSPHTPVPQLTRPSPHTPVPELTRPSPHTPVPQRKTPPPVRTRPGTSSQPIGRVTPPPIPTPASSGAMQPFGNSPTRERRITARGLGDHITGDLPSAHARSTTDVDDIDTLRGEHQRSELLPSRAQLDTIDPELPQVRFKPPTHPPGESNTARPSTATIGDLARKKRPSDVTIGHALIERRSGSKKTIVLLACLGAAGAAATAVTVIATRGDDVKPVSSAGAAAPGAAPMTPERVVGTVKFITEPADAEIKLVDKKLDHTGSPWTTQLEPGVHQIQIQRSGYKSWLTSIELSANETQTLRVVLEPITQKVVVSEATLILTSTPDGLEAFLDGNLLGVTPVKAQIKPGAHAITLRQNGAEVWRQTINAKASANYEFNPDVSEEKQRERAQRAAPVIAREDKPKPPPDVAKPAPSVAVDKPAEKPPIVEPPAPPATPPPTPPAPEPVKPTPPAPPVVAAAPPPQPAAAPRPSGPVLVPPTAVTRVSGDAPTVGKSKRAEVPPVVAAKVCIDSAGKVSNVEMITKLERLTSMDLTHAIKTWRYAPYKQNGAAVAACFVVSFKVQ